MAAATLAQFVPMAGTPFYPDGDEELMAESDLHYEATAYCIDSLKAFFADRNDVYVAGDNFLYFIQGRPRAVVSPDCYVIFGAEKRLRKSYKVWEEEGRLPSVVFEITSDSTREDDINRKFNLYQDILGVAEYFLFDPTGDYIDVRLTGYRLEADVYRVIERDADGHLHSLQLGLHLLAEGTRLRFFDPIRGMFLPTLLESQRRTESAEAELAQAQAKIKDLERYIQEMTSARRDAQAPQAEQE